MSTLVYPDSYFQRFTRVVYPLLVTCALLGAPLGTYLGYDLNELMLVAYLAAAPLLIGFGYYRRIAVGYERSGDKLIIHYPLIGARTYDLRALTGNYQDVESFAPGKSSRRTRVPTVHLTFSNGKAAKIFLFTPQLDRFAQGIISDYEEVVRVNCERDVIDSDGALLKYSLETILLMFGGTALFTGAIWMGLSAESTNVWAILLCIAFDLIAIHGLLSALFEWAHITPSAISAQNWRLQRRNFQWSELTGVTEIESFRGPKEIELMFADGTTWRIYSGMLERSTGMAEYFHKRLEESKTKEKGS